MARTHGARATDCERSTVRIPGSTPSRDRGWRRSRPAGGIELLNAQWHGPRGIPSPRFCPVCDASVSVRDAVVHHGGELYHPRCTPEPRPSPAAAIGPPPRVAAEMVPIEHETAERVVRTIVFAVPPAALALGAWLAWGGSLHWQDLVVLAITYTLDRTWRHRRLSPAVHPPQLQDHPPAAGAAGRARLDGGRGPGDRMGLDPPQAPPLLRPRGRPAQPTPRPRAGVARGAARAGSRARRLDVPRQGHGQPRPLRQGPDRRPRPALHQPHLPALGDARTGLSLRPGHGADRLGRRAGSPGCCGAERCASSSCTT